MSQERPVAVTVGALYVSATAAGAAAAGIAAPTDVELMAAQRAQVIVTAGLIAVMAVSVAGTAAMLYPLLLSDARTTVRRGMATWFLGSRLTEGALFLVSAVALLALLAIGEGDRSATDGPIGAGLRGFYHYAIVAGQSVFSIGAAFMCWLLLVSGRVPRWMAIWGLAAAPLMLTAGLLLPITQDPTTPLTSALYAPMALQEMVLAAWLIARGFQPVGLPDAQPAPTHQPVSPAPAWRAGS